MSIDRAYPQRKLNIIILAFILIFLELNYDVFSIRSSFIGKAFVMDKVIVRPIGSVGLVKARELVKDEHDSAVVENNVFIRGAFANNKVEVDKSNYVSKYTEDIYKTEYAKLSALEKAEVEGAELSVEINTAYRARLVRDPNMVIELTKEELDLFYRLVECEAGNQDMIGRILVADTIINRVKDCHFPNSVSEVILYPGQYDPVTSGKINNCEPSDQSIEAVHRALNGEEYSGHAFYFMNRRYSCKGAIRWFDTLPKTVEHQDHEFFTEYFAK